MAKFETCDKNGRPIRIGDIVKVFHFIGARNKRHYMFKQIVGERPLGGLMGKEKVPYFVVSHLDLTDDSYYLGKNEGQLDDYEIVQCINGDISDRPKVQCYAQV